MNFIEDEVEYSHDCEHCAFHRFMELLGFNANINTCWIDCTKEIQENVDQTFSMILCDTYVNNNNEVRYIGNTKSTRIGSVQS